MMPSRALSLRSFERLASVLLLLGAGCSFVDPQAGAPQATCGISFGGGSQGGPSAGYYHSSSAQMLGGPTCATSSESACDDCESAHCCAARSACYGDPVCACADLALDECLDAAKTSAVADEPALVGRCWNTFSAKGTAEQARISCQRSWCQTQCEVP
jgi:hypothetical protein